MHWCLNLSNYLYHSFSSPFRLFYFAYWNHFFRFNLWNWTNCRYFSEKFISLELYFLISYSFLLAKKENCLNSYWFYLIKSRKSISLILKLKIIQDYYLIFFQFFCFYWWTNLSAWSILWLNLFNIPFYHQFGHLAKIRGHLRIWCFLFWLFDYSHSLALLDAKFVE